MNKLDEITQKLFPTIMVPKFSPLPELEVGKTRLLMASGGLYIETKQPWGSGAWQIYEAPRPLPYGHFEECDEFLLILNDSLDILSREIIPAAALYADQGKEWAGWIVYEDGTLRYMPLDFEATAVNAHIQRPDLPEGCHLAMDCHSHGTLRPFFSSEDNNDDKGGVKISLVLGSYNKEDKMHFKLAFRYCIEGFFFELESGGKDEATDIL